MLITSNITALLSDFQMMLLPDAAALFCFNLMLISSSDVDHEVTRSENLQPSATGGGNHSKDGAVSLMWELGPRKWTKLTRDL